MRHVPSLSKHLNPNERIMFLCQSFNKTIRIFLYVLTHFINEDIYINVINSNKNHETFELIAMSIESVTSVANASIPGYYQL